MKLIIYMKQKKIFIILMIASLLSTLCIVKMEMPKKQYYYEKEVSISNKDKITKVIYEKIPLSFGVYDVELEYDLESELKSWCTVIDTTVLQGGLLTNGETLYKEVNKTGFRMWLFENTENLQVQVSYGGEGSLVVSGISFYETNALWTIFLTIIWGITILMVGIMAFKKFQNKVGLEYKKKNVIAGLFLIVLISSLPYLFGACMKGENLVYHLNRIEGVKDGILNGIFPIRIESRWLFDYGYANSIFECNTLLYIPAVFRLLGFTITTSYNLYCILLNIATACVSYFCFSKIFKNQYIGLLCSALYTLSIFRIYKLMIIGAIGEGSSIIFIPLVLYGLYRAFSEDVKQREYKTIWIPIAIGYAGLMQTHILSFAITVILTIFICLIFLKKIFVKETILELAKGAFSALAVSFWFLIPFLDYYIKENMHIRNVSARTIQEKGLYLPQLFFNWWELGNNETSVDMGIVQSQAMGVGLILGIAFCVFSILWFSGKWKEENNHIIVLCKVSCLIGGILMTMSLNVFPWDTFQRINGLVATLVGSIESPNHFLGWGTTFLIIVMGGLLWYFLKKGKKWYYYLTIISILIGLITSSLYLIDHICCDKSLFNIYSQEGMDSYDILGAGYVTQGTDVEALDFGVAVVSEGVEILSYEKKKLKMQLTCENNGMEEGYVELPFLYYTGYRAYVMSTDNELPIQNGTNNIVRINIPTGFQGEIEVKFVSPLLWRISEIISYAWWIMIGLVIIKKHLINHKEKRKQNDASAN